MHSSYSLHIPKPSKPVERRRKRKAIQLVTEQFNSYKYVCISCRAAVYFCPGHELVCSQCASRTVEKIAEFPEKRKVLAR